MAVAKKKSEEQRAARTGNKATTASLKELFKQRDATKPGSKEEDQAVDRIMEAMFPDRNGSR